MCSSTHPIFFAENQNKWKAFLFYRIWLNLTTEKNKEIDTMESSTIPNIFRNASSLSRHRNLDESPPSYQQQSFTDIELSDGSDCVVFNQNDLPNLAFPTFDSIRRSKLLIDVTIFLGSEKKHPIYAHK